MKTRFLAIALAAPLVGTLALSSDARACGGCVVPPEDNTIVNAHRMALSISPKQTVLWDQIRYNGDPESWGWLLPVKPGAVVEISTDAWFETLDAATTTSVFAPPISCGNSSSGIGCGAMASGDSIGAPNDAFGKGVTVVHRGTVGPFDTVTLSTQVPGVLDDWLTDAGFNVPADSAPVIDAYVAEGYDFIALKLQPDKSVDEMKPVRVVQPGANPTLPLRMVAVGTGANVAITLYVIGEGRWEAKNSTNTLVPLDLLSWDFATNTSNYGLLRDKMLDQNGGDTWLTTFAKPQALLSPISSAANGTRNFNVTNDFNFVNRLAEAYVQQGLKNGEATDSACSSAFTQFASSGQMVTDPCEPGVPSYDPSCGTVPAGEIDARVFECGATDDVMDSTLDDIATALTGMHPKDVWVTRLEADLPRAALANDLIIEAAASQTDVDADIQARSGQNIEALCGSGVILLPGETPSNDDKSRMLMLFATLGAGLLALTRRRLRDLRLPAMLKGLA